MIIQAPTGSGKTAVAAGPHVWPTSAGKTTLMVCPLLSLETEMVDTFRDDFGLKAVAINSAGGKLTTTLVKELLNGTYQIVLISPEMLQSPAFVTRVLRRREFSQRVLSVVVDEAHCVSHWGADFRKKYGSLGTIRAFLPRGTPVIAVTATLTARVRRDLHRVLHFSPGTSRFLNLGNDRPNVTIANSYADLDFILPASISRALDIPKTYLYVDDIRVGSEIIDHLNDLLALRAPSLASAGLIRPYNATLSHEYRQAAMAAFRASPHDLPSLNPEPVEASPCIRILVCTDAAGMGCNVPDVDLVVQWKLPKTLSSFVQRAGRAARSKNRTGLAVLLVERAAYSVDLREAPPDDTSTKSTARRQKKTKTRQNPKVANRAAPKGYAQEHGVDRGGPKKQDSVCRTADPPNVNHDADDEGLLAFVQAITCRRKIWADIFDSQRAEPVPGVACCDICDPTVFDRCRARSQTKPRKTRTADRGYPDREAISRLEEWREAIFARDLSLSQLDAAAVLDNATIKTLASIGPLTAVQVADILQHSWIWWKKYGEELTRFLLTLQIKSPLQPVSKPSRPTAESATPVPASKRSRTEPQRDVLSLSTPGSYPLSHLPPTSSSRSAAAQPSYAVPVMPSSTPNPYRIHSTGSMYTSPHTPPTHAHVPTAVHPTPPFPFAPRLHPAVPPPHMYSPVPSYPSAPHPHTFHAFPNTSHFPVATHSPHPATGIYTSAVSSNTLNPHHLPSTPYPSATGSPPQSNGLHTSYPYSYPQNPHFPSTR
ncbi:P-loop containing nucleoside triphosphate hydrolase protein [Earliella scabrosa]|nr:P-loop containing nucleoside triphosphate hydrolase protein [Earliella scabrosa]